MSYLVRDGRGNIILPSGTLDEARKAVTRFINSMTLERGKMVSEIDDRGDGVLTETYIFNREDIDENIILAIIEHDSIIEA